MDGEVVLLGHGGADGGEDLLRVRAPLIAPHLLHHHQTLLAVGFHREGGATGGAQRGMARLDRALDVLGIVVLPADDDQVLAAAGDEQLSGFEIAEVAGAQEGTFAGIRRVG